MLISVGDLHEWVADHILLWLLLERTLEMVWVTQAGQTTSASTANDGVYKKFTLVKLKKFKPLVSSLMLLIFF